MTRPEQSITLSSGDGIGKGHRCFIIAEAGVNHNGSRDIAFQMVDAAARAGANAIKFQTFNPTSVVSVEAPKAKYQERTTGKGQSQLEMLHGLALSADDHGSLVQYCRQKGVMFLSTPFDKESIELLAKYDPPLLKVASGEITNSPFLELLGAQHKPVVLSTGMSYLAEVEEAVRVLESAGCSDIILLHCVSSYPADPESANLRAMKSMRSAFQRPVGFSDHTPGIEIPLAAAALGACVIEKHFTLNKAMRGPDHAMSLDPVELRSLVDGIRLVEKAMGDGIKRPTEQEEDVRRVARRSVVTSKALDKGTVVERDLVEFKRPGHGFPPSRVSELIGRRLRNPMNADAVILPGDLE